MKFFLQALKDLIAGLVVACFAVPILVCCVVIFEFLDPFVRFYDTLKARDKTGDKISATDTW